MNFVFELLNENHFKEIADIEQFLWGGDYEYRKRMLRWKYLDVPFEDKLTGAVAIHNNKVIGFRGLVPAKWNLNDKIVKTFFYTDAVVHPDYRGHKLLARLNNFLKKQYQDKFQFVLALSSNDAAAKVYKSQGAVVLTHCTTYKKIFTPSIFKAVKYKTIPLNSIDSIWNVFEQFREQKPGCFNFIITKEYLQWKLSEPNKNFVFICDNRTNPRCYSIIEKRKRNIEVYDFGFKDDFKTVLKLLQNFCKANGLLYINFPLYKKQENELLPDLKKNTYSTFNFIKKIKPNYTTQREILIKPFKEDFTDDDWSIAGLNAADHRYWNFKHLFYV